MKTVGIIAEYNPLHTGHQYHIEETKKETGADRVIVAMSGNFVQRGAPALIDKYTRAKSALMAGADLVLQIPPMYSLSSAEFFAKGAVTLLINTGVVNYISFGTEDGTLDDLKKFARILADEPVKFKTSLQKHLRNGNSFPNARAKAFEESYPEIANKTVLMTKPNNILAIEYLKQLNLAKSKIKPIAVKRVGAGYNDPYSPGQNGISSKAIREAVYYGSDSENLKKFMTDESYEALSNAIKNKMIVHENDFSQMLIYKLLSEREQGYTKYLDVSDDLSDRIINNLDKFTSVSEFCDLLKTKDKTYTRISRSLFHILLGITETDMYSQDYTGPCPFIRILGFKKSSENLVSEMKSSASVPIITGYNDAVKNLYSEPMKRLQMESRIEDLYFAIQTLKSGQSCKPDMSRPLIVL